MGLLLLLIFIAVPIAEIAVFIEVGERFGLWPTLATVILTAVIGTTLLRWQGLATLARATESMQRNELPLDEVVTGVCLLFAGALLLTPGFITDAVGFALFVPPVRRFLSHGVLHLVQKRGAVWVDGKPMNHPGRKSGPAEVIIEGEFEETQEPPDNKPGIANPDSPWNRRP